MSKKRAKEMCIDILRQVQMPDPEQVLKKYPHELSGGMRQRVMIAMAVVCEPDLLIADEPTTALDVTVQGQVLAIITSLSRKRDLSILIITHDMGVVAQICDRIAVMYAGKIVELATVEELFKNPIHPYTQGLIASIPDMNDEQNIDPKLDKPKNLYSIPGSVPNLIHPPKGCRFHPRCDFCVASCNQNVPELNWINPDHSVACHNSKAKLL